MQPTVFSWPPASVNAICLLQSTTGAGNLVINGSLATTNSYGTGPVYAQFVKYSRNVSLTSTSDLSEVAFTITGTLNGAPQTVTRNGPSGALGDETVETKVLFDTVTSISTDDTVPNVTVGTGTAGFLPWRLYNYHCTVSNLVIQTSVTGTINYSFLATLDDVQVNKNPLTFTPIAALTGATANQLANTVMPLRYYAIKINSGDGAVDVTFVQQGIN